MLDYLYQFKDEYFDTISFLPIPNPDDITVLSSRYTDDGEKIGGSKLGDRYHILLFKWNHKEELIHDDFEAILICPLEYISHLIDCGWHGMVSKKTTTSQAKFDAVVKHVKDKLS